jgi:predicted phosphodiesterase
MTKYLVFSDIHGASLAPVREMFEARKVDVGICIGDFDRVYSAREAKSIQKDHPLYVAPGNHDQAHLYKRTISSGRLRDQGVTSNELWDEWDNDQEATKYINDMLNNNSEDGKSGRSLSLDVGGLSTRAIHGGLAGTHITEPADLWNRIESEEDYMANFSIMRQYGIKLLLRGHDHEVQYARLDPKTGFKKYDANGGKFNLFDRREHIVSPGAYFKGEVAVITTGESNPVVEFKQF